jgi:hypothetical protein
VVVTKHNTLDNGGKAPHIHNFLAKCTTWSASGFTLRKSPQYPLGKRQKQSVLIYKLGPFSVYHKCMNEWRIHISGGKVKTAMTVNRRIYSFV